MAFYRDVLGMRVLSPPYVMAGDAIREDMGQLVSDPTMKAAIVGFDDDGDRVLEVIEYLGVAGGDQRSAAAITDHGLSHVGLICEDLDSTRAQLEANGVRFLVDGIAEVARVRTTWFVDPLGCGVHPRREERAGAPLLCAMGLKADGAVASLRVQEPSRRRKLLAGGTTSDAQDKAARCSTRSSAAQ